MKEGIIAINGGRTMFRQRHVLERMLATTGITINGNSPWDLHVRDREKVIFRKSLYVVFGNTEVR